MGTETELKLEADVRDFGWIDELAVVRRYQVGSPALHDLNSIYFDTPDLALRDTEVSIRLRNVGGRWVQTVKAGDGAVAGLHQRQEWEAPVRSRQLDLDRIESKALRRLIKRHESRLTPIFATRFQRRTWDLQFPDGTTIEVAADRGAILVGEEADPISEVELELRRGDVAKLYDVAIALCDERALTVSSASKAQRAYDLLYPAEIRRAMAPGPFAVTPEMSFEDAFLVVARRNLECLHENERVLFENASDAEALRQIRLAARRLSTCLDAFKKWIPAEGAQGIERDLRWLRRSLATARSWDIFLGEVIDPLLDDDEAPAIVEPIRRLAERACRLAYADVQETISSARYTKLLLTLGRWIATRAWRIEGRASLAELDGPAGAAVHRVLTKRARRLDRRKRALFSHSPQRVPDLHRLLRESRDLCRCFDGVLSKKSRRAFRPANRLCATLNELSRLRRIDRQLAQLGQEDHPAAVALVRGTIIQAGLAANAELKRRWRTFVTTPTP